MVTYFKDAQSHILAYRTKLQEHNMVMDKTTLLFLNLILDILEYLGTEDPDKLDELCEYNVLTMRGEFDAVIKGDSVNEKVQATLLIFFLRIAKEMDIKYKTIENKHLKKLYTLVTSKDFKYPSYIKNQKVFALESMPENIKRMLYMK
ncbi:MAG: hypothetical protein PHI38_01760 [Sulfurimonas sp.]|jgi:hypothetical protein|uniref:hypothetical protein n=1 Tax=Sulfurimonas sp. TaxID=2022749 RepID=UPI00261CA0AB|nr:hypothetical protein [Sulfurimonas sp.]MDD3475575.1 hypothetical protein [Sulfurimonas sp.]HUH41882.1 hypothetical protein [Sulfurimonas sp.]